MLKLLKFEFYKLFKTKKTWFSVLGMSFVALIIFFIFTFLYFFKMQKLKEILGLTKMLSLSASHYLAVKSVITGIYSLILSFFSLSSLLFISILIGEIMSNEFGKKTIKILFLQPYSRTKIYLAKFLTIFFLETGIFLFNVFLYWIIYQMTISLDSNLKGLISYSDLALVTEISFLVNLSFLVYIFFISTMVNTTELTIGLSVFLYFLLRIIDAVSVANSRFHFLPEWFSLWGKYSFTSVLQGMNYSKMFAYLSGKLSTFPINKTAIIWNWGYIFLFLVIGALIFNRREV